MVSNRLLPQLVMSIQREELELFAREYQLFRKLEIGEHKTQIIVIRQPLTLYLPDAITCHQICVPLSSELDQFSCLPQVWGWDELLVSERTGISLAR